jgi:hypothetical protein
MLEYGDVRSLDEQVVLIKGAKPKGKVQPYLL